MKSTNWFKTTLAAWPIIFGIVAGICYLTTLVSEWAGHPLSSQPSLEAIRNMRGLKLTMWCLIIVIGAPLAEELIFRFCLFRAPLWVTGKMLKAGPQRIVSVVLAVVSAILFTAAHYRGIPLNNAFVALFAFGIAQCVLLRRTHKLLSPILNHALFNSTNLVLLFAFPNAVQ